jgi:hypothetical protein
VPAERHHGQRADAPPAENQSLGLARIMRTPGTRTLEVDMKTLCISLTIAALLGTTVPPSAWSMGPGGGAGGHVGRFSGGAAAHLGLVGRVGAASPGGPLDHPGRIDGDDRFEYGGMLGFRDHINERFDYPVCFAYPYCPAPVSPCALEAGYSAGQPSFDEDSAETAYGDWVPPGCY